MDIAAITGLYVCSVEFVLQTAVNGPLLSLSPELHRGHTWRWAYPGENTPLLITFLLNINILNFQLAVCYCCETKKNVIMEPSRSVYPLGFHSYPYTSVPHDLLMLFNWQVAVTAVAMSFDKEQTLENGKQSVDKTQIKGEHVFYVLSCRERLSCKLIFMVSCWMSFAAITENDEQLQFNLELNAETSSSNPLSSPKGKLWWIRTSLDDPFSSL